MNEKYILSLDQGTTSSRAILFDKQGIVKSISQKEIKQIYPNKSWVEHDAKEIWASQVGVAAECMASLGVSGADIAAIGITNQRETTIIWDLETGEPIYNAIVWQDKRSASFCDQLREKGYADIIKQKTGLILDSYFSASKIKWLLDNVKGARKRAEEGLLAFGTVDSWLCWKLSKAKAHVTDVSNASRTMLYNINSLEWDSYLLDLFDIPSCILPKVCSSSEIYAYTDISLFSYGVPISGIAGDQQASSFGQMCFDKGCVKTTYGTGCFMLCNTGTNPVYSNNNLLTSIAWQINGSTYYALEGSIFMGGAVVQWLRDGLGIIKSSSEVEALASSVCDNGGVYMIPAFTGLGAPYWDQYARGSIMGLCRDSSSGHIARAGLEAIAFQVYDVLKAMEVDAGISVDTMKVDGGAAVNNLLMQFQSDILSCRVVRSSMIETTALGVAFFAGLAVGFWSDLDDIKLNKSDDFSFYPSVDNSKNSDMLSCWHKAIWRSSKWLMP